MIIIAHLDMDAFFAAVEERDKPRLKGRPIVVGADPRGGEGRGVVATANYKAREYGIYSATPISKAWQLSEKAKSQGKPAVIFIGGNHRKYGQVSKQIMKIIQCHSPVVQQVGLDEAYFDLTKTGSYKNAKTLAQKIKKEIKRKEKLTASIGIGPNKLIAKIASDYKKPEGLTIVTEKEVDKFLEPLSVRKIPGIGPKTEIILSKLKIKTVKDLKEFSESEMKERLGKWGMALYRKSRGLGSINLTEKYERKSIGEEVTFSTDSSDMSFVSEALKNICHDLSDRLKKSGFNKFRTMTLKVRLADFSTRNRSKTFKAPIADSKTMEFEALRLLLPFFDKRENKQSQAIRLIGIRLEKLS
jgi:DNA polymerase IV (archaeal DinB-like DNA polymerase)